MDDVTSADILTVLEHLSPHQRATLDQLVTQEGQGCNLTLQVRHVLQEKGLIFPETDLLTGGPKLCACGQGHHCYTVADALCEAYEAMASLSEEEESAPVLPPEPPAAASVPPRRLVVRSPAGPTHWTRFTLPGLGYFTYNGVNHDRGQLLTLKGGPRDEQLERLGYVYPLPQGQAYLQAQCGSCQQWFLTEKFRDDHGRLRHSHRFADDDLEITAGMHGPEGGAALRDITGDADERRMQQQYPLHLDRTKATLEG